MPTHEYHFVTEWQFNAPIELVFSIIEKGEEFQRWWPDVYLSTRAEKMGRADRIGDKLHLHTRGWLPYPLRWTAELVSIEAPRAMEIKATGDFVGRGQWTLTKQGSGTHVRFDWHILAEKPILRYLSFMLKPIFAWNHRWAMERGYIRFQEEIARLSAASL